MFYSGRVDGAINRDFINEGGRSAGMKVNTA